MQRDEKSWDDLKNQIERMEQKLEKLFDAVVGNQTLGNYGIVKRLNDLEQTVEKIENQIAAAKSWVAGALFVGSVVGFLISRVADYFISK